LGIVKAKDGDEGEVFEPRYGKPEYAGRSGYLWSTKYLNDEQLRNTLITGALWSSMSCACSPKPGQASRINVLERSQTAREI
jgi:hypothetical protein